MKQIRTALGSTILVAAVLLSAAAAHAQSSIALTASRQTTTLPDGSTVPMWGWTCGATAGVGASCTAASGALQAGAASWQPPLITVAAGGSLSITLSNALPVASSLVIFGQPGSGLAGTGLGNPTREAGPRAHDPQSATTWAAVGGASFTPPAQGSRARSFGQEAAPAGTQTYTWGVLKPGTYLIESGTYPSIQGPMGLYGVLVVTAPLVGGAQQAYPGIGIDASAVLLLSEIDPVQNTAADTAVVTAGFSETAKWTVACAAAHTCYPPAVDYAPLYYLVNGTSFSAAAPAASTVAIANAASTGKVLLRFVNAGLRMHVPTVVGQSLSLIAEDANVAPDVALALAKGLVPQPKVQSEVFLAAGKTFDVTISPATTSVAATATAPAATSFNAGAFMMFDRQLSLSTNNGRDGGMQAYVQLGAALPGAAGGTPAALAPKAVADNYTIAPNAGTFSGNVLANDIGILNASTLPALSTGAQTIATAHGGTAVLLPNGTFTYTAPAVTAGLASDTFSYFGNGLPTLTAQVTIAFGAVSATPVAVNDVFVGAVASLIKVARPGVLSNDTDPGGHPLTAILNGAAAGLSVVLNADGSFTASATTPGTHSFTYHAVNSQGTPSNVATASLTFGAASGLQVSVLDTQTKLPVTDYRWVLQQDMTFKTAPGVTTPPPQQTLSSSFHKSYMPVVASGCTGPVSCQSGQTVFDPATLAHVAVAPVAQTTPGEVALDPTLNYYLSVLPGDAADPVINAGGGPVSGSVNLSQSGTTVTANTGAVPGVNVGDTVMIASDTVPGYSGGYVVSTVTSRGFTYTVSAAGLAADTGTYTRPFNIALDCTFSIGAGNCGHTMGGSPVPAPAATGATAFAPVTVNVEPNPLQPAQLSIFVFEDNNPTNGAVDGVEEQQGLGGFQIILNDIAGSSGMLIGQMSYDMLNMPLTNALNGRIDTANGFDACYLSPSQLMGMVVTCPSYEYDHAKNAFTTTLSPLAGQALIRNLFPNRFDVLAHPGADRVAAGENWIQTSTMEGTHATDAFAKVGEPGYFQEFGPPGVHAFVGFVNPAHINSVNASLAGTHKVSGKVTNLHMSRPWSEALFDSKSHAALSQTTCFVGLNSQNGIGPNIAFSQCDADGNFVLAGVPNGQYELVVWDQWQDQILEYQSLTVNGADVAMGDAPVFSWFQSVYTRTYLDNGTDNPGIGEVPTTIRFRDGQFAYSQFTDSNGSAVFSETFPLFSWYVMESDTTRYKGSKVSIVNDAGGLVDTANRTGPDGTVWPTAGMLNSTETFSLPASRQVPGAIYQPGTTLRIDPGSTRSEGFQAFISQPQFISWGKALYNTGENGGILGHVVYDSTRPFDDPTLLFQNLWEPLVPGVTINLYQVGVAADGTRSLVLVDSTLTSGWDGWANGSNAAGVPNMNCPGQNTADPYYTYTLGAANQYKCYDGFHNWNQVEPAPYDGRYAFPTTACTICTAPNPNSTTAVPLPNQLPAGRYVVEVVVPTGFELVKEEDKNILIGDAYIAPVAQQFGALGAIFIVPDQASINAANPAYGTGGGANNPTTNMGRTSIGGFGPGGLIMQPAQCVGRMRVVPDYLSLFPNAHQVAPFAGATRALCDRKEIGLTDQMQAKADFFVFTPTPVASKYTGIILDDLSAEFNTTRPDYGEKFAVPFVPVSFRDFNGIEVTRTYADQFGMFNGMVYSTWDVNPPNPAGYAPNMMIACMNDPGPIVDRRAGSATLGLMIPDPMYNPQYSNFCYSLPYMPGTTDYMDTPLVPQAAFAAGYNPVDCAYPDTTPAVLRVDGDGSFGPWVSGPGATLRITALGDVTVPNNAYAGPSATATGLANQATIKRHYGFGTALGTVSVAGHALTNVTWSDMLITGTVAAGTPTGELMIAAANGKSAVDTVTVNVGGKAPTYINPPPIATAASPAALLHPIQDAIDAASPGDLIMLNGGFSATATAPAGTVCLVAGANCAAGTGSYPELVIMWKPVRLQGVGAASVMINAAKYPTQKLQDWRVRINALFGLDLQGNALPGIAQADALPGQEITGGIVLLEPSVLGTEEGAGITVLAKNLPAGQCTGAGTSNFLCAASRIDGVTITGGDAGGGVYVNGWAHGLEISNNRVYGNAGTYTGGVRIGQPYLLGLTGAGPFGFNDNVSVHNNAITTNGTVEANNGTGGVGGGLSMNAGSDGYSVRNNFVCGNFSLGDGGGVGHMGVSWGGVIANNTIIFNQSNNQSSTVSGGGLVIEGEAGTGTTLSLGTGNVTVDSNLILGNQAQGGHGGGVRLQDVNGADIQANPNLPSTWWSVTLTNNVIANNSAGWAGGGLSLSNTVMSNVINNTIASNDSTATVGPLFNTPPYNSPIQTTFQPAGVSSELHSPTLATAFGSAVPASLVQFSNPRMENNIIYRNRAFRFTVTSGAGSGANPGVAATSTLLPTLVQTAVGQCPAGAHYWDLGVLGQPQTGAAQRLNPTYSMLTTLAGGYGADGTHNSAASPGLVHPYCNGSRADPGIPDGTPPSPPFTILVAGAEDEGGNWVDVSYGPLSLSGPATYTTAGVALTPLGDYSIAATSLAVDTGSSELAPNHDYLGTARPQGPGFDKGAFEVVKGGSAAQLTVSPPFYDFGNQQIGTTTTQVVTVTNDGNAPMANLQIHGINGANAAQFTTANNCPAALPIGASCSVTLQFRPPFNASGLGPKFANFIVTSATETFTVALSGTGQAPSGNLSPVVVAFTGQLLNTVSVPTPVVVTNTGVGPLVIAGIAITSAPAGNFAQTNTCGALPATVPVGGTCTINVVYQPLGAAATSASGTMTVTFLSPLTLPTQRQAVTLAGTTLLAAFTQIPLVFGTAPPADTVLTVQVNNNAAAGTLGIRSVTITGGAAWFTIVPGSSCAAPGATVAAGNGCDVNVRFTQVGASGTPRTGSLVIVTTAGTITVPLTGN